MSLPYFRTFRDSPSSVRYILKSLVRFSNPFNYFWPLSSIIRSFFFANPLPAYTSTLKYTYQVLSVELFPGTPTCLVLSCCPTLHMLFSIMECLSPYCPLKLKNHLLCETFLASQARLSMPFLSFLVLCSQHKVLTTQHKVLTLISLEVYFLESWRIGDMLLRALLSPGLVQAPCIFLFTFVFTMGT